MDTSNTPPPPLATQNCGIHSDTATGQKGIHMDTSDTNCGIQTDTPFNYQNSTTVELQVVDTKDASGWATPTPPHALAAKAGDADGGRYEKLYDAYGTATRYPEGKAAFAALNPSPADFETMILAAARHREWCVADGRATTYRPALPKWITDCHWKEDEPRQGRMVKPKAKATMKADAVAAEKVAAPAPRPAWTMREVVIEREVDLVEVSIVSVPSNSRAQVGGKQTNAKRNTEIESFAARIERDAALIRKNV